MTREALGQTIIKNQDCFYRIAKTMLNEDADCKDAISQMIVKAYEKIHTLKKDEYAKTWLTRILINECYALIRTNKKTELFEEISPDIPDDSENYSYLYEAITSLPYNYRICITLYYIEGFNIKEIAKLLNSSESAIKKRLVRARACLKLNIEGGCDS